MSTWRVIQGDCRDVLVTLPERSVHTCVTSPPYFGLRDYGTEGQIGLEPTPDAFVAALVDVFREVRRVLRDDGTVWLNLGDSYAGSWGAQSRPPGNASTLSRNGGTGPNPKMLSTGQIAAHPKGQTRTGAIPPGADYKAKDLLGIPWMVAFALRADGWYLRSDIIWSKPNSIPESVTDRPTKAHEYVFLLSKGPRYFYDADAIRETAGDWTQDGRVKGDEPAGQSSPQWNGGRQRGFKSLDYSETGRNKRSVWTIATQPYAGAHFATFPPKLIEPCILAGAPERACGECGAPWVRQTEVEYERLGGACGKIGDGRRNPAERTDLMVERMAKHVRTLGFEPSCSHNDGSASGIVLDPFAGAGTTGVVALRHGRSFVGIELSPAYAAMARWRIRDDSPLLNGAAEVDPPGTTTYEGDAA